MPIVSSRVARCTARSFSKASDGPILRSLAWREACAARTRLVCQSSNGCSNAQLWPGRLSSACIHRPRLGSAVHAQDRAIDATIDVCAALRPQAGRDADLRRSLLALVAPPRSEPGNIAYGVQETSNGTLFLYEAWRSQSDLDLHLRKPYVVDFVGRMDGLIDGGNEAHFGRLISSAQRPRDPAQDAGEVRDTVHICSFKHPRPGKAAALRNALLSLKAPTSAEDGHITYNLYEERDGSLFLHEVWRSFAGARRIWRRTAPRFRAGTLTGRRSSLDSPRTFEANEGAAAAMAAEHVRAGQVPTARMRPLRPHPRIA